MARRIHKAFKMVGVPTNELDLQILEGFIFIVDVGDRGRGERRRMRTEEERRSELPAIGGGGGLKRKRAPHHQWKLLGSNERDRVLSQSNVAMPRVSAMELHRESANHLTPPPLLHGRHLIGPGDVSDAESCPLNWPIF